MDSKIKNIVFDLGGVLVNLDSENCLNAFRKAGIEDIEQQVWKAQEDDLFPRFERGEITAAAFRDAIRQQGGESLTDRKIDDLWNLMLVDIPREKLDLLLELRGRYMVYLLSNTNIIHWEYACENLFAYRGFRVEDFFEQTFLSFEMHLAKPDTRIYEQVLKEANLLAEETCFIDDSLANCEAAHALGIHAIHYCPGDNLKALFEA